MAVESGIGKTVQIPLSDRVSVLSVQRGNVHIDDGAFSVSCGDATEKIPVANLACVMMQPGTTISHAAVAAAAAHKTLLIWIGEEGVRLYSAGIASENGDKIVRQALLYHNMKKRLAIARKILRLRFGDNVLPPVNSGIEELRGYEGAETARQYKSIALKHGIEWQRRENNFNAEWNQIDLLNKCLNIANSCLYGISEAAILIAGYSPAIGFIHSGDRRSFVFDVADIFKFTTVVPIAFEVAAGSHENCARETRRRCRDLFFHKQIIVDIFKAVSRLLR